MPKRGEGAAPAPVDPTLKEDILRAVSGNTELLQRIREAVEKKEEAPAEAPAEEGEGTAETEEAGPDDALTAALSQYYNNMEEHVHKENVKCYRNVQAALSEQGTQIVEQTKKALVVLKIFDIVSTALGVVNIALFVCYMLGII